MAVTNVDLQIAAGGAPGQPMFVDLVQLDLDASYPAATGGYPIDDLLAAQVGTGRTFIGIVCQNNIPGVAIWCAYDQVNGKLQCYDWAGAEIANGTNLAAVVNLELGFLSY